MNFSLIDTERCLYWFQDKPQAVPLSFLYTSSAITFESNFVWNNFLGKDVKLIYITFFVKLLVLCVSVSQFKGRASRSFTHWIISVRLVSNILSAPKEKYIFKNNIHLHVYIMTFSHLIAHWLEFVFQIDVGLICFNLLSYLSINKLQNLYHTTVLLLNWKLMNSLI